MNTNSMLASKHFMYLPTDGGAGSAAMQQQFRDLFSPSEKWGSGRISFLMAEDKPCLLTTCRALGLFLHTAPKHPVWDPDHVTDIYSLIVKMETSLAVQWLRLCITNARGTSSIPGGELRSYMLCCAANK